MILPLLCVVRARQFKRLCAVCEASYKHAAASKPHVPCLPEDADGAAQQRGALLNISPSQDRLN
jgi:hypothetical protein